MNNILKSIEVYDSLLDQWKLMNNTLAKENFDMTFLPIPHSLLNCASKGNYILSNSYCMLQENIKI